jgi:hypothetical protein
VAIGEADPALSFVTDVVRESRTNVSNEFVLQEKLIADFLVLQYVEG